jgi:hypothetical protein
LGFVLLACVLTGCWEKIEYHESPSIAETADKNQAAPEVTSEVAINGSATVEAESRTGTEAVTNSRLATNEPASEASAEAPVEPAVEPRVESATDPTNEASTHIPAEPEAVPVAVAVAAEPTRPAVSARRAAWRLGSRLSLAALANDRGIAPEKVPKWFNEAESMAGVLKVAIAPLPERPESPAADGAPVATKFLVQQLKSIGKELATIHGMEPAALFDLAVKSNLLLIYNKPGTSAITQIAESIRKTLPQTNLPAGLYRPLLDALSNGSPPAAVRQAVTKLHADVDAHLAESMEQ